MGWGNTNHFWRKITGVGSKLYFIDFYEKKQNKITSLYT